MNYLIFDYNLIDFVVAEKYSLFSFTIKRFC